ncbi:MAG: guanylate kinase, partial [Thermoguttaceae bacterium]
TKEEFDLRRQRGEFIECFEVFGRGYWYGTLKSEVSTGLEAGKWVVLEIDVQGAMAVMQSYPDAISIFVLPDSVEELQRRLRGRGTETEEALQRRLQQANSELALAGQYGYRVVNDDLDRAVQEICDILTQEIGGRPQ